MFIKHALFRISWCILVLTTGIANASTELVPIDTNHSTIGFSVPILGGISEVTGKFTDFEIEFKLNTKDFTKSKLNVAIQAKSINTGIAQRDGHLRTRDFFSVRDFPEITYKSSNIRKEGDHYIISGDLTMRGNTRQVDIEIRTTGLFVKENSGKSTLGFSGQFVINRDDFDIKYRHDSIPSFIGTNVKINLNILTKSVEVSLEGI